MTSPRERRSKPNVDQGYYHSGGRNGHMTGVDNLFTTSSSAVVRGSEASKRIVDLWAATRKCSKGPVLQASKPVGLSNLWHNPQHRKCVYFRRKAMARSSASAHVLTDREEIQSWAEERNGKPACVRGTGGAEDVGMIRIDFPGYSGENSLQEISWDEWFDKFQERGL